MNKNISAFGSLNPIEIKRSLRDGCVFVFAAALSALILWLEGADLSGFGNFTIIVQTLVVSFLVPFLNRWLNIVRT